MGHDASTAKAEAEAPVNGRRNEGNVAGSEAAEALTRLRFDLLRSALYHDNCERSLQRLNRTLTFVTILLSSAAVAALGADYPRAGQVAGAIVATIAAAQLVWDFAGQSIRHGNLRRRFYDLLAEAEEGGDAVAITAKATRLFSEEPPISQRRNRRAHNLAGDSIYGPGKFDKA